MALGINTQGSVGGEFLPIVKFDCRAGRMFRRDRENGENTDVDITKSFKAVMDLDNIEVGWIDFDTGGAPSFALGPIGQEPERPTKSTKRACVSLLSLQKNAEAMCAKWRQQPKHFCAALMICMTCL